MVDDLHYNSGHEHKGTEMNHTKHSLARMSQRGIGHAMAELIYAYGSMKGDKFVLNQKAAMARLKESRAEKAALNNALNVGCSNLLETLRQLEEVETEIRNLMKLIDKHGAVVVMVGESLITAYGLH